MATSSHIGGGRVNRASGSGPLGDQEGVSSPPRESAVGLAGVAADMLVESGREIGPKAADLRSETVDPATELRVEIADLGSLSVERAAEPRSQVADLTALSLDARVQAGGEGVDAPVQTGCEGVDARLQSSAKGVDARLQSSAEAVDASPKVEEGSQPRPRQDRDRRPRRSFHERTIPSGSDGLRRSLRLLSAGSGAL